MNRADYIRQVDALDLPDGLRQRLGALPSERRPRAHNVRPYRHWTVIAAALMLVVGLGAATPAILHALAPDGGEITTPPPIVTESPAIPDKDLAELLAAQIPHLSGDEETELLFSARRGGRTLGVLRYRTATQERGYGSLIIGLYDDKTRAIADETLNIIRGNDGQVCAWEDGDGILYLLWTNYTVDTGVEQYTAGLYAMYDSGSLLASELPIDIINQSGVPSEAVEMFHWKAGPMGFWDDHKAVINGAGLDLYVRTPGWAVTSKDKTHWTYLGNIPLPLAFSTGPDAKQESPELRAVGDNLFIRYPGKTEWTDVLPMLPMPAERRAPAIEGLTSMTEFPLDKLYFGFTSPTEGWLALGGNDSVWLPYNYIYLTHDGGYTWVDATGDLNDQCTMFLNCAVFSDEKHGFLGYRYEWGGNAPILWTQDGGKSWKHYVLPLPTDDNTIYELTDIAFVGSAGTLYFTRHTRNDQGQPVKTEMTLLLSDYGTTRRMDDKPIFKEPLDPYSIKSSQLPYGDPINAWSEVYDTLPLQPLARLPEAGINLYGLNEYWCGTGGVLLVRDRDMSTAAWYDLLCYRSVGGCSLALSDYDGDGQQELAMVLSMGSGTGVAKCDLYMVELEGRGFRSCTAFDEEVYRPLVLDALRSFGAERYDQFGQWQIYSLEEGAIHMELAVRGSDDTPNIWRGSLSADVCWDGRMFSLKNAQFTKYDI